MELLDPSLQLRIKGRRINLLDLQKFALSWKISDMKLVALSEAIVRGQPGLEISEPPSMHLAAEGESPSVIDQNDR